METKNLFKIATTLVVAATLGAACGPKSRPGSEVRTGDKGKTDGTGNKAVCDTEEQKKTQACIDLAKKNDRPGVKDADAAKREEEAKKMREDLEAKIKKEAAARDEAKKKLDKELLESITSAEVEAKAEGKLLIVNLVAAEKEVKFSPSTDVAGNEIKEEKDGYKLVVTKASSWDGPLTMELSKGDATIYLFQRVNYSLKAKLAALATTDNAQKEEANKFRCAIRNPIKGAAEHRKFRDSRVTLLTTKLVDQANQQMDKEMSLFRNLRYSYTESDKVAKLEIRMRNGKVVKIDKEGNIGGIDAIQDENGIRKDSLAIYQILFKGGAVQVVDSTTVKGELQDTTDITVDGLDGVKDCKDKSDVKPSADKDKLASDLAKAKDEVKAAQEKVDLEQEKFNKSEVNGTVKKFEAEITQLEAAVALPSAVAEDHEKLKSRKDELESLRKSLAYEQAIKPLNDAKEAKKLADANLEKASAALAAPK